MNYHIIVQEKFFECYIEDIYRLGEEANNVIWVRGNEGDGGKAFHTTHPVEYLGPENLEVYREKLSCLKKDDKLFISWYNLTMGRIISRCDIPCPIYVYLLGGEFYNEPEWIQASWLFEPMTRKKYFDTYLYSWCFPPHKPWRWYRYLSDYMRYRAVMNKAKAEYEEKNQTLACVDYIVLTEHSGPEIEFVKLLYPACHAKHLPGVFDQNFELAEQHSMRSVPAGDEPIKILFGHSGDPTGNQLDGLHYIKNKLKEANDVYTFLSYGDENCRKWTAEYGQREFGNHFHAITNFMTRPEFVDCLNEMDVLMMYHNRQQAEGNIMTSLVLGKPVFIKPENPQYGMLKRMGVKPVYDVHEMHKVDLREAIRFAQANRADTIQRIAAEYSMQTRLKHVKNLICD